MKFNAWCFAAVLALAMMHVLAASGSLPTFADVIKQNGSVSFSDGSSIFTFSQDGSFSQRPVSISGRTVEGKWTTDAGGALFSITGNWSWMNGLSPLSDSRRMVMVVYPSQPDPIERSAGSVRCKCYFEIEELGKLPAK